MDEIITEDTRRDLDEIEFEVNCPYCNTTSKYNKKDIKKRYCFRNFRSIAIQYTVQCPNCDKRLYITSNVSR